MHAPFSTPLLRYFNRFACLSLVVLLQACGTVTGISEPKTAPAAITPDPLTAYALQGDTQPVHDPSVMRQGKTSYVFSSDSPWNPRDNYLSMRCSNDEVTWTDCGRVFTRIPEWVSAKIPGIDGLWAPDVSFFNGLYHVYYAGSTLSSQRSVIGLATNTTLDASDPSYKWVDRGEVLESNPGDDFNAIDPNILIDDGRIWMTYGSYWSGIKQVEIQPLTGLVSDPVVRHDIATRPGVPLNPIEGASLVHHGNYYYLFVSIDFCCFSSPGANDYKEAVGRSSSPNGPFVDINGTPMMRGGATVLLSGNGTWNAPGGGTAYIDPTTQESRMVFHALDMPGGAPYLWVKQIDWVNEWPVLRDKPGLAANPNALSP
jgi:arabinan endo-1,5-alpha-L-arabinosidase